MLVTILYISYFKVKVLYVNHLSILKELITITISSNTVNKTGQ